MFTFCAAFKVNGDSLKMLFMHLLYGHRPVKNTRKPNIRYLDDSR